MLINKIGDPKITNPQGSILGHLLFIIYVNDLPNIIENRNINITIYADDTAMTFTQNNNTQLFKIIKNTIYTIEKWYELNNLKIKFR